MKLDNFSSDLTTSPHGLLCDLLSNPELGILRTLAPSFGWIVPKCTNTTLQQQAYQIRVDSNRERLNDVGNEWDSGRVCSAKSINIPYQGKSLQAGLRYWWTVRIWVDAERPSPWASPQCFEPGTPIATGPKEQIGWVSHYPLQVIECPASEIQLISENDWFIDFGKDAFGWLELEIECDQEVDLFIRQGEMLRTDGRLNSAPPGSVRSSEVHVKLSSGCQRFRVETVADPRNTGPRAIHLPNSVGVVMPFRYVEISLRQTGAKVLIKNAFRQQVEYLFSDEAAAFHSSNTKLDSIWELCRYTIKATSFAGFYVDGDRERIPYEGDAYINQISHYACDREYSLARRTFEYLMRYPTWPTEWKQHLIFMAWSDYEATGDERLISKYYQQLVDDKLFVGQLQPNGLLATGDSGDEGERVVDRGDLVDWPPIERDGFDFREINSVVNAFYYRTLILMSRIATRLGKDADATSFSELALKVYEAFNATFLDPEQGLYLDGAGSTHISQHANLFPLAFGLVPEKNMDQIVNYVKSRGIACSVYVAQYLLEGLFLARESHHAIDLMVSEKLRGWSNMLKIGATMTCESWDQSLKPNMDWNHAWGTPPINLIARYVLGVQPLEPGYGVIQVDPQLGNLSNISGTVPTIRGPVHVHAKRSPESGVCCRVDAPGNVVVRMGTGVDNLYH